MIQIKPISSLNRAFQLSMLQGMLSKISLFLEVQMIQQVAMTISLKMIFPKFVLASITISKGGRFRFQKMPKKVHQSWLKVHSKKRCIQVSSSPQLQWGKSSPLGIYSFFSACSYCSIYPSVGARRKIYACLGFLQTTSTWTMVRRLEFLVGVCMLSWSKSSESSTCMTKYPSPVHHQPLAAMTLEGLSTPEKLELIMAKWSFC